MMTKQPIVKKLNVPADTVWAAIRKIGKLDVWFPIIETCRVEGEGAGASRYMTIAGGGDIKDTIEEIMALMAWKSICNLPNSSLQRTSPTLRR
ncbi:MAG: SRPBCC family protein [Proteobacteria bacterium]|nr:SRPBCC family protein [Pseudomonadota bacterium]